MCTVLPTGMMVPSGARQLLPAETEENVSKLGSGFERLVDRIGFPRDGVIKIPLLVFFGLFRLLEQRHLLLRFD